MEQLRAGSGRCWWQDYGHRGLSDIVILRMNFVEILDSNIGRRWGVQNPLLVIFRIGCWDSVRKLQDTCFCTTFDPLWLAMPPWCAKSFISFLRKISQASVHSCDELISSVVRILIMWKKVIWIFWPMFLKVYFPCLHSTWNWNLRAFPNYMDAAGSGFLCLVSLFQRQRYPSERKTIRLFPETFPRAPFVSVSCWMR